MAVVSVDTGLTVGEVSFMVRGGKLEDVINVGANQIGEVNKDMDQGVGEAICKVWVRKRVFKTNLCFRSCPIYIDRWLAYEHVAKSTRAS